MDPASPIPPTPLTPPTPQSVPPVDQVVSAAQPVAASPPVTPVTPTAPKPFDSAQGKRKEQAPFDSAQGKPGEKMGGIDVAEADKVAKEEGDEYWENYAREIELEKEIMELGGVEKVESGEVKVPEKVATEMGIKPITNIQTPISNVTNFSIKGVSLSDDQLSAGLTKPTSSGIRWLVEWFIYQLMKAHYHIQRIKGRIIRTQTR